MKSLLLKSRSVVAVLSATAALAIGPAFAHGPVGGHVNELQAHVDTYAQEVDWLIGKVDGIVTTYENKGREAAKADAVVDHWEAVDFHAAIETTYVPVYAAIWQGLYGVKEAIDKDAPIAEVRQQQEQLEQALWQALGAVKLAAQFQQQGLLAEVQTTDAEPGTPVEIVDEIKQRLDRVVAKYAEKLPKEATTIVHDTYLNRFEGIEGMLIEKDAALVEDLEKDFNVTLPKAIQGDGGVDQVRSVVQSMHHKLNQAKSLLIEAEKNKRDVF